MKNSFLFNIALLILINLLIKPAYVFAIEVPVQNLLGNDVYGMYFIFLNLAYIFQLVSDLGLQNVMYSDLPRDRSKYAELLSNAVSSRAALAFIYFIALGSVGGLLGYWSMDMRLFLIVMLNVLLISTFQFVRANVSGLGLYFRDSILSSVDKLFMLIILLALLYGGETSGFTIYHFALAQTISLAVAIVVGLLMIKSFMVWQLPSMRLSRKYFRMALPHGILIALMFLYTRIDAVMIEKMMPDGFRSAGLYASVYRLYDVASMISYLAVPLLLPMFSELEKNLVDRSKLFHGSFNLVAGLTLVVAIPVVFHRDFIMHYLYTDTSDQAISALGILFFAFVCKSLLFISSALLTAYKRFLLLGLLFGFTVLLNIVTNYWFIPIWGIEGAAWTTGICQLFLAVSCFYFVHTSKLVMPQWAGYFNLIGFAGITCLIAWSFYHWNNYPRSLMTFIVLGASIGLVYLVLNIRQIAQLRSNFSRP